MKNLTTKTKKRIDWEYQTQYLKELDYLTAKGIRYTFAKTTDEGVRTYKYEKTPELFLALAEFYLNKQK